MDGSEPLHLKGSDMNGTRFLLSAPSCPRSTLSLKPITNNKKMLLYRSSNNSKKEKEKDGRRHPYTMQRKEMTVAMRQCNTAPSLQIPQEISYNNDTGGDNDNDEDKCLDDLTVELMASTTGSSAGTSTTFTTTLVSPLRSPLNISSSPIATSKVWSLADGSRSLLLKPTATTNVTVGTRPVGHHYNRSLLKSTRCKAVLTDYQETGTCYNMDTPPTNNTATTTDVRGIKSDIECKKEPTDEYPTDIEVTIGPDGSYLLHLEDNSVLPTICNEGINQGSHLNRNIPHETEDKPHHCTVCNKRFHRLPQLNGHKATHRRVQHHLCTFCDKTFHRKLALYRHMHSHMEEKLHHCTVCDKQFHQLSTLSRHTKIHTRDKPYLCTYRCTVCDKPFYHRFILNRHMLVHTCDKRFRHKSTLNSRRTRFHTGDKPDQYTVYVKKLGQKYHLKFHIAFDTKRRSSKCTTHGK